MFFECLYIRLYFLDNRNSYQSILTDIFILFSPYPLCCMHYIRCCERIFPVGMLRSFAEMTAQQQAFPRWVMANHEASCMVGNHGAATVLEAVKSGLGDKVSGPWGLSAPVGLHISLLFLSSFLSFFLSFFFFLLFILLSIVLLR